MPADGDYSSSGESGSEGSLGRSQEDPGSFVLQKRNLEKPSGHPEGNGMLASAHVATGHMAMEKPMMLTPGINVGMEYWSGPMMATGHEVAKVQYAMAPAAGTVPYNGLGSSEGRHSGDMWSQDDREQKREKRKQANRESARRSRMRKQFEYEDLAEKVTALTAENDSLKLEVNRLGDLYKQLSDEKNALLERVQKVQS